MSAPRDRVPRPPRGGYTFACTRCLIVFDEGVEYTWCPRCNREVDWIDGRFHVWACRRCDMLVDGPADVQHCAACQSPMTLLVGPKTERAVRPLPLKRVAGFFFVAFLVIQTIFALFDPNAYPYLATLLVFAQGIGLAIVAYIALVARDVRALWDARTRILHGLEHATANVLAERGIAVTGGITYGQEFVLSFVHDGRIWERLDEIRAAAVDAIRRVRAGEHELAIHRQCGTTFLVAIALYGVGVVAAGAIALALGVPTGIAWAYTVAAGFCARAATQPLGRWMQRHVTVSTDFASATVTAIERQASSSGDRMHVTIAVAVEPAARSGGAVTPFPLS